MVTPPKRIPLEPPTCDDRPLWDAWLAEYQLPALSVADEVGLFALLARAPATAAEVVERLSTTPRATEALLGVLAALGFLIQHGGRFHLTDLSRNFLLPESPFYYRGLFVSSHQSPLHEAVREALLHDRRPDAERITVAWGSGELDAEEAERQTRLMHSHSFAAAMGVARHGDFSGVRTLLDVGGGSGCFCIALAARYPALRCTVMELAPVCELVREYVAQYGLKEQIDTLPANMFRDPWPGGYDAHFFGNIFHDWDRERCRFLARRSFETLPSGGRIYVHEMLLAETKDAPPTAALFSLLMAIRTEGSQFTASELEALLCEAGFAQVRVTPTYGYYSLVMGTKV